MTTEPGADGSGLPEPRLTVAAVARRLGAAPATLRTWDRRYGLGPTLHPAGAHRRYSPIDLARLETMRRLMLDGVPPAEAARVAVSYPPHPRSGDAPLGAPPGDPAPATAGETAAVSAPDAVADAEAGERAPAGRFAPGGRVLAIPGATAEARGLGRAAMALDATAVRGLLEAAVRRDGVLATWDGLLRPVLVAVGARWAATGLGVEVEHLLAATADGVLRSHAETCEPYNGRPVLLACAPEEQHSLPLSALAAALAECGVGVRMLGGRLPADALAAAVRRTGAAVVLVLSIMPETADPHVIHALPVLRPPTTVLAGGSGWTPGQLPTRAGYVPDLRSAVDSIRTAVNP